MPFSMPRGCSPGLKLRPRTVAIFHEIPTKLLTLPCFGAPSMSQPGGTGMRREDPQSGDWCSRNTKAKTLRRSLS